MLCRSGISARLVTRAVDRAWNTSLEKNALTACPHTDVLIPCEACNRTFRSQTCFDKHKTNKLEEKTVCEQKRNCANCNGLYVPTRTHECFKSFCDNCKKNREYGHLCYMAPLVNKLPKMTTYSLCFTILKRHKIRGFPIRQHCTFPTSYACNSSAHNARCRPI